MKIKLIESEGTLNPATFQKKYGDGLISAIVAFAGNAAHVALEETGDNPWIDDYKKSLAHNITYLYNLYLKPESSTAGEIQKWIKKNTEHPVDTTVENVESFVKDWFTLSERAQYAFWDKWETWVMRRINEQIADTMDSGPSDDEER